MSKIYIGQYYGKSFASKLIQWRTLSKVSHTSAFLQDKKTVIEAWNGKVRKNIFNKGHKKNTKIAIYSIDCLPEQSEKFYAFVHSQLGKKYDWLAILGFALSRDIQDNNKWFCSELIYEALNKVSLYLLQNIKSYQVTPGKLNLSPILNFETMLYT